MKSTIILVTATATFWADLPAEATEVKGTATGPVMGVFEVTYKLNGKSQSCRCTPGVTTSPQQIKNLLAIR